MGRQLVKLLQVGKIKYGSGLHLQQHFVQLHKTTTENQNTLIIVEHPHVYTTGIRDSKYSQSEEEKLKQKGAEFYRTNRGGLITYHGPGQLVAYPILNLHNFSPRIHWYIDKIEKTILNLCNKFKLEAELLGDRGVWIKDKKICSVGLHGSRYITSHGFALNCNPDLSWFDHIVPCGIEGKGVTSLSQELGREVTIAETLPVLLESFKEVFEVDLIDYPEEEAGYIHKTFVK
ncbi:unnamed protein product [Diabrotica balteata]|uniref:Octanoyl-[acyl-carrier-protein]:protein N-octanoyltransferase LIPT2, mitochondrial n=1 Tax=Diabrotica balteata TaxID=107213 RepID=A0A9N9STI3_DIABA|nr:unnamed protein product [Diabrotica balteata]